MKNALSLTTILGVCLSAAPAHAQFRLIDRRGLKSNARKPVSMGCLNLLARVLAAGLLFLFSARSQAQAPPPAPPLEVDLYINGQGAPVATQIDQAKGDTDPKLNGIGFDLTFACGAKTLEAKGHAVQSIPPAKPTPAGPASALFDSLTVTNTCAQTQSGSVVVYSSNFFPAIAVFAARARLWGKYVQRAGREGLWSKHKGVREFVGI